MRPYQDEATVKLQARSAQSPVAVPRPLPQGVDEALATVRGWSDAPFPASGSTIELWELLATLAVHDLAVARAVEPHLDALAILAQADLAAVLGAPVLGRTWGVFAAEGPGAALTATQSRTGWTLSGIKPWCSLADRLDAALVTAALPDGERQLFAVDLRGPGIELGREVWVSRGLAEIPSVSITLHEVDAEPVGAPGWYVARPGFSWGAMGVAACWYGGAVGLGRSVWAAVSPRADQDLLMMYLGRVDERLESARRALVLAAEQVDAAARCDEPDRSVARLEAKRVRAAVARACEEVLDVSAHALGPAPLALDEDHAKRVVDLQVYVRQHHAERDLASLGRTLAGASEPPW